MVRSRLSAQVLIALASAFTLTLTLSLTLCPHQMLGAELIVSPAGGGATSPVLQVFGDPDDEWRFLTSMDLRQWTDASLLGTVMSGRTNPCAVMVTGDASQSVRFYRAQKTKGLYDPALFRTISLTFTQSNWGSLLATARTTGVDVNCLRLTLDNGITNAPVGVRYKGNTSYTMAGTKKSINVDLARYDTNAHLMGYETVNLNNAFGDETIMREPLYFNIMSQYTPCPQGGMARVHINGTLWGVYSLIQQENGQLMKEWFPNNNGDRWRAPNAATGGGGGGGGGGFTSSNSALSYFQSTNISAYTRNYELKTDNVATNVAWARLIRAITVLNTTPTSTLREALEDVLAVDDWLWFLALENIFVDDDSYWNKGADYGFYYDEASGRIHPVEHDGNESFTAISGITYTLSPVQGATGNNRPLLYRLLPINELRQRYLAHMRTVLQENFNPAAMTPRINAYHALSSAAIVADPNKGFTLGTYTNELNALRTYVTNRYNFLTNHAELRPLQPSIVAVHDPSPLPLPTEVPFITAQVQGNGGEGIDSVWLYWRDLDYGKFNKAQMFDDGEHGDGASSDGLFGAATTNYAAGHKIHYYVEARAANTAKAAAFAPARAEWVTYSYRVALAAATNPPVVINEIMAANTRTISDPQGHFDDWIELRNRTDQEVDLTGHYLSDEPNNPRKWQFPDGTKIPAGGYLIVWADEDGASLEGLHASFKLSAEGEQLFLVGPATQNNELFDSITYGVLAPDQSYGRTPQNPDVLGILTPTPNRPNE